VKNATILANCIWLSTLITGCREPVNTFSDDKVSGGDLRSPSQKLFAHVSEEHYLEIRGKIYRDVVGGSPYYLDIPALHSILFVTGSEDKGNVKFHIVNEGTGHDIVINGGTIHFGMDIGAPRQPGQAYTDFVTKANSNEVTLATQYPTTRVTIVLSLDSKKVGRIVREAFIAQK
jgi:hypothetical protein